MTQENPQRSRDFKQLKWGLQGLAMAGSLQRQLFPDYTQKAEKLASDFEHWFSVVRADYAGDLSMPQAEALAAIDRKLAAMSRDGVEFDAELWTDTALTTSEQWADVRRLAASALEAFGWHVDEPAAADQTTLLSPHRGPS